MLASRPNWLLQLGAFVLGVCCAFPTPAGVYYVRSTGSDSNTGTQRQSAFRTIQKALDSATSNDVIYIGSGTYVGGISRNYGNTPGSLRLVGDTTGKFTGDKGSVTIEIPTKKWGLRISNAFTLIVSNIEFVGETQNTQSNACELRNFAGYSYFYNCSFENLVYGIYARQVHFNYALQCRYQNILCGEYVRGSTAALSYQSIYKDTLRGVLYVDVNSAYVHSCHFKNSHDQAGNTAASYPVRAYRTGLTIANSEFNDPTIGVYGRELAQLQLADCQFNNPASYAVYAIGQQMSARDVEVLGTGQKKGWGLRLDDTTGARTKLSKVTLSGLYGGLATATGDYDLQQVTLLDNQIGLYVDRRTRAATIDSSSRVTFKGNHYAILASHQPADPASSLTVRGQSISNNTHGIYAKATDLVLEDCIFRKNAFGVRAINARQVMVNNCEFRDNGAGLDGAHYGLSISAEKTSVDGLLAVNNYTGLLVQNLSDQQPTLRNIQLVDNEYVGLWLREGASTLTGSDEVVVSNSRYGVYSYRTDLTLTAAPMPTGCTYPLYCYEADLRLAGADIREGKIGIYSVRSPSVSIHDTRVQNQQSHGLYLYQPGRVRISSCNSSDNASHGLYCFAAAGTTVDFLVTDSAFTKNKIGFRTIGIPVDAAHLRRLDISGNTHGLRVERAELRLTADMQINLVDNRYAVMSYYGRLRVGDVKIAHNDYGLYAWQSPLQADGTQLSAKVYGIVCYTGDSELLDVDIRDAQYGVFFSARDDQGDTLSIKDSNIENTQSIGIYVRSSGRTSKLDITNTSVIGGNRGIYSHHADLIVNHVTTRDTKGYGIAQVHGTGVFENVVVDGANNWGIIAYGDSAVINATRIKSRYGLQLRTLSARVVNSVIQDSLYGIYTNNPQGKFEIFQSTIGNISRYGVLHHAGQAVLQNCIVQAKQYALWNRSDSGSLSHDHNLIHADRQSYVNELPGEAELDKLPVFLNPQAGDLHLAEGSPAINAGTDLSAITQVDLDGNARPSFQAFEMGAFEFTQADGSLRIVDWQEKAH